MSAFEYSKKLQQRKKNKQQVNRCCKINFFLCCKIYLKYSNANLDMYITMDSLSYF